MLHLTRKDLVRRDLLRGLEAVGGTCSSCWRSNAHHCSIGPFVPEADRRGILQSSEVVMTGHCPSYYSVCSQALGFISSEKAGRLWSRASSYLDCWISVTQYALVCASPDISICSNILPTARYQSRDWVGIPSTCTYTTVPLALCLQAAALCNKMLSVATKWGVK
jgi:hypothetical protein